MNMKSVPKKKANSKKASRSGARTRAAKPTELLIHGSWSRPDSDQPDLRYLENVRRLRNPWVPPDIVTLIKLMCSTYGASKAFVELVKAWMNYRSAKKIEIKVGDSELKIEGAVSDKALENRINKFKDLIRGATYDDIDVVLPKGANRRMPPRRSHK
jgi:hypothetical protein